MNLPNHPKDFSKKDLEEINSFDSFQNIFGKQDFLFQRNILIPEEEYNGQFNIIPQINLLKDFSNNDLEEINSYNSFLFGKQNFLSQRNGFIPEEGYSLQFDIIPQVIEEIKPNNSNADNTNVILEGPGDLIEVDNPPNEPLNQTFESHAENVEVIIHNSNPEKKIKIFKVIYPSHTSLFDCNKYDDYSERIIQEVLNEMNKNKKKRDLKGKKLFQLRKKRKKKYKFIYRRKQRSDNIMKKIKARFLKSLKIIVNLKLKKAGTKLFFSLFPQPIVCNINRKANKRIFNMTLKDVYFKNFNYENSKKAEVNIKKYKHNLKVLDYLEKNNSVSEKSNFNVFKNMKLSQIYKEYLSSKQFAMSITNLKKGKENVNYIKDYIIKAHTLLNYFNH